MTIERGMIRLLIVLSVLMLVSGALITGKRYDVWYAGKHIMVVGILWAMYYTVRWIVLGFREEGSRTTLSPGGRGEMTMIRRWWKGEERLVKVFWASMGVLVVLEIMAGFADGAALRPQDAATMLIPVALVYLFLAICTWRSAFNVTRWSPGWLATPRSWGYLARMLVVSGFAESLRLLLGNQ